MTVQRGKNFFRDLRNKFSTYDSDFFLSEEKLELEEHFSDSYDKILCSKNKSIFSFTLFFCPPIWYTQKEVCFFFKIQFFEIYSKSHFYSQSFELPQYSFPLRFFLSMLIEILSELYSSFKLSFSIIPHKIYNIQFSKLRFTK